MITTVWSFMQDENNRAVISWIGGGAVAVAGATWAIFKFLVSKRTEGSPSTTTVTASHGGIAAGRDIHGNKIDMRGGAKR
jgi:hypothetical protein